MILAWGSRSGRAWQGRTGRGTMEGGAEPHFHQVWRAHSPGVGPFSCREGGQAEEPLEQDKADVVQSPKAGGGSPGGCSPDGLRALICGQAQRVSAP